MSKASVAGGPAPSSACLAASGRLDVRRAGTALFVQAFWPEPGVRMGAGRTAGLISELERVRGFVGVDTVEFCEGWRQA